MTTITKFNIDFEHYLDFEMKSGSNNCIWSIANSDTTR